MKLEAPCCSVSVNVKPGWWNKSPAAPHDGEFGASAGTVADVTAGIKSLQTASRGRRFQHVFPFAFILGAKLS